MPLVDINRLPLDTIEDTQDGGLRIGALVRNSDLAADQRVRQHYGVLSRALLSGASAAVAQQGHHRRQPAAAHPVLVISMTLTMPCNKRSPGSGCAAMAGFNRMHAILGASDQCIATQPVRHGGGDARARRHGRNDQLHGKTRAIPIADFHRLPGQTPQIENGAEARRDHHRGHAAAAAARHADLSQGARPGLVRFRFGVRGRDRRHRGWPHPRRTSRVRRSGAEALARAGARRRRWSVRPPAPAVSTLPRRPRWMAQPVTVATISKFRWRAARCAPCWPKRPGPEGAPQWT